MKSVLIHDVPWPIAEAEDFVTTLGGETFALFEDEDGGCVYGYGHVPNDEFVAEANRYLREVMYKDDFDPVEGSVTHLYAMLVGRPEEIRFTWKNVMADTPGAFPMTMLWL